MKHRENCYLLLRRTDLGEWDHWAELNDLYWNTFFKQIFSFDFLILFSRGCFLISQDSFNFVVVLQRTLRFWWCRVPCHAYEIRTEKYVTSKCQWPEVVFLTGLMMSSLEGVIEWALSYHVKLELSSRFQSLSHHLLLKNVDSSTKPFLPCSNHISFKSWCLSIR